MIQFVGVEEIHIRQMSALLAKRHEKERQAFPFLPSAFEEIDEAEAVIRHQLEKPFVSGIAAVRGIDVIGYLLYEFKEDTDRGRYVHMGYESIAISEKEHPSLLRLLYADAGAEWVKHGYFTHVLMIPLGQQLLVDQWLEQGFCYEQKYAVLSLQNFEAEEKEAPGKLKIRRGKQEDAELLKKVALWNSIHQAAAPSWHPITKETMEDIKRSYMDLSEDKEAYLWIAELGERIAGFHVYFRLAEEHSLSAPPNCAVLPAASTNPDLRGKGIGRVLANHCFTELKNEGFDYVYADWRTPNQLASYFWPKLGFEPFLIRMSRKIDPRIAWAHGV
ncbi:GNAT family N-acetyltransferase [Planococcus sp. CAU13]|uniref:GNAT family N-acetyltransferase n=1 Tax=Planococcus sp. CAU13 TaxID=1541197 RepID=UPI00052FE996|nr:GNAT family N-acetyltransferase [Planococcus sp. CAU13]